MTDVSTYDDHPDGRRRPEPEVPAGLADLMAQIAGPPDHWDRPEGPLGPLAHQYRLTRAERESANSHYRMGSKALARDEWDRAADCLGAAAEAGHPGALFRLAALAAHTDQDPEDIRFLVAEAARHGHGDAQRLLVPTGHRSLPPSAWLRPAEDPAHVEELWKALNLPQPTAAQPPVVLDAGSALAGRDDQPAPRLVPVPAPRLARHDARPRPKIPPVTSISRPQTRTGTRRPALWPVTVAPSAPATGPRPGPAGDLSTPPVTVPTTPVALPQPPDGAAEQDKQAWWESRYLRPARLTGLARNLPQTQQVPPQWKTVARARELLHLIENTDGITTRDLARRTGLSFTAATHLLHWLRGQHLVDSIAGEHRTGPRLDLARIPGRTNELLAVTLDGLCESLGAAIYYSQYTDGEVRVLTSASGPKAPPVTEDVPFPQVAHASAVGKSLLAQLDFEGRMDHLSRYEPFALTGRTITDPQQLFAALDGHGPQACQFDLLEYSDREVCAAVPLSLPGRAACIALSLPAHRHPQLLETAHTLSQHSAGILLALLLADTADSSSASQPAQADSGAWPSDGTTAIALP
ncbi:IclR family transcriptional regulator C-terminal domain-containing protein [Streptomyces sp. NPDC047023]|uniref:IclR family transcriptional regulator domain-containing protein n=1 Tax=Streptomyces sp. NPDC047023 TaxID=3155139 RepID=UPI0033F1F3E5